MIELRYELAISRIREIEKEELVGEPFLDYFRKAASFISMLAEVFEDAASGKLRECSIEELQDINHKLYAPQLYKNYESDYSNPDYCAKYFGGYAIEEKLSFYMAFLMSEIYALIPFAYEGEKEILTIYMEFFLEIYGIFSVPYSEKCNGCLLPNCEEIRQCIYWFERDNLEIVLENRICKQINPACDFATKIILNSNLSEVKYLYFYGEHITDNELECAKYLSKKTDAEIENMARAFTEGYRVGFEKTGKDISKKKSVNIRYNLGFERVVLEAIKQFRAIGLEPVIYRASVLSLEKRKGMRIGYLGNIPNRQYDYDHKEDDAIYIDKDFLNRRLEVINKVYDDNKIVAGEMGGPALIEVFGDEPFTPDCNRKCLKYSEAQKKMLIDYENKSAEIVNKYVKGEERSYTIIAFPIPKIGNDFEAIFEETIKLNTLDYKLYENMQQILIDAFDKAKSVHVLGRNGNETDLTVALGELKDCLKETNFENCVADVNIPVGEVFTTPKLKGTDGLLHVKRVFLENLEYIDLKLRFKDGVVSDYSCSNFDDPKKGREYIEKNLLFHNATLPMGEFAIGTNTTAYVMAHKYDIEDRLPILIAEKCGPHFAVGDTCYSYEEDLHSYNPDGKEIVARENDYSRLRKIDVNKAYFHCHTDITIPYEELKEIDALCEDGTKIVIIKDGLFMLPGLDELNKPLKN